MATTRFADHILQGDHASRPAAADVPEGTLYACSTHDLIYQSDAVSTWSTWATMGAGAGAPAFHGVKAYRDGTVSINAAALTFDAEEYDTDAYHEGVTNPSRLTCPSTDLAGYYQPSAGVDWPNNDAIGLYLKKSGSDVRGSWTRISPSANIENKHTVTFPPIALASGEYLELFVDSNETWGSATDRNNIFFAMYLIGI